MRNGGGRSVMRRNRFAIWRLFGNRLDNLFNRGEGFAFYPTRGVDFVTMVIKGPPGAGKSTLALQMCVTQAQQGNVCLYFSLEDERGSLVQSAAQLWLGRRRDAGEC